MMVAARVLFVVGTNLAGAFVVPSSAPGRRAAVVGATDPTKVWYAEAANVVQSLLTNSPLNEGKKFVVKALAGPYDEAATRAKLDAFTTQEPVTMLSFRTCPFCVKAKAVLDAKGAKYAVLELDEVKDGRALRAELGALTGRTSVPAIFIGGNFIGGCNDGPGLVPLDDQGKLDDMLAQVGAV